MNRHHVLIVTDGAFGEDVARRLVGLLALDGRTAAIGAEAGTGSASIAVRASWRDVEAEWDLFAAEVADAGVPWLPVAYDGTQVRVGPGVIPGGAPCYSCYRARVRQHNVASPEFDPALLADPALGVREYPPHVAAMAAGLALVLLRAVADGASGTGQLYTIDCDTDGIDWWHVVPAHACPECDSDRAFSARTQAGREAIRTLLRSAW
jgi:bacteriocin biosynthesis cyclodehydratase domain-containing protein